MPLPLNSLATEQQRRHVGNFSVRPQPTVTVVIPTLNEAENLPHVLPYIPSWVDEVAIVDGHSTDGTTEIARQLLPNVKIIQQKGRGKGAALRTGFEATTGDIIIMMDADCSTNPAEILLFCIALVNGAEFVKGSRFMQGAGTADMEFHRMLGNWVFVQMVRILFGGNYSDLCYGYNAFWRRVLPQLDLDGDGFEIETMMNVRALRAGLKVAEVPSFEEPRRHGVSRLRAIPDGWRVLKTIFRERFTRSAKRELTQAWRTHKFQTPSGDSNGRARGMPGYAYRESSSSFSDSS